MRKTGMAALMGLAMAASVGGAALAQAGGAPKTPDAKTPDAKAAPAAPAAPAGHMSRGMSDMDMKTMTMCRGMAKDAMQNNKTCMDMMKAHPEMMKPK
jgi:hypothetical protein